MKSLSIIGLILSAVLMVNCQLHMPVAMPVASPVAVPVAQPVAVPVPVGVPVGMGLGLGLGMMGPRMNRFMRKTARLMMASNMVAANMAAVNIAAANIATGNMAMIGKRDVSNSTEDDQIQVNKTFCSYSSQRGILSCHGLNHNFDCDVTQRLSGFEKLKLKLSDLELVPAEEGNFNILRLLNTNSKFTVVEPFNKKQIVLSLFNAEHPSEPGFMIRDSACWSNVESLVRENQRENVRLAIFL